ncbi:3-keto-disaccharide hydrolase [Rudanella paleaurantiibacter]|nr:DUF1080 domain-containing protein [Rudanella paleaurantiibacter]
MKRSLFMLGLLAATLTAATPPPKKTKWTSLFDGKTTTGWHRYLKTDTNGWKVESGALTTDGKQGDLVSDKEFENFDLEFEFKVQPKGNSGVIYKVLEDAQYNQTYVSGPEYQVIDDKGYEWRDKDGKLMKLNNNQLTAANYDMIPPGDLNVSKPAGEWNKGRILVNNNHVEHWLNGKKVVEYEYGSDTWKGMVAKSKFAKMPYANPHGKGKIALQGHGDTVWYRNIRVKEM